MGALLFKLALLKRLCSFKAKAEHQKKYISQKKMTWSFVGATFRISIIERFCSFTTETQYQKQVHCSEIIIHTCKILWSKSCIQIWQFTFLCLVLAAKLQNLSIMLIRKVAPPNDQVIFSAKCTFFWCSALALKLHNRFKSANLKSSAPKWPSHFFLRNLLFFDA